MEVKKLTEKTLEFLRRFGHLDSDKPPRFRANDVEGRILSAWGNRPPYNKDPMHYQEPVSGDALYERHYHHVQKGLSKIAFYEFHKLPLKEIPDSEECVLIDIGSGMGRQKTRPVAKAKPNLRVYMIDRLERKKIEEPYNFKPGVSPEFAGEEFKVRVPISDNIEETVNTLLEANGYKNLIYIHRDLKYLEGEGTNLPELSQVTVGRRVFFTGYQNPDGLGNITIEEAIFHEAEKIYFNNTGLEKIRPDANRFKLMKNYLQEDLNEEEIKRVIELMYDPRALVDARGPKKYDYKIPAQKQFAIVLKQLFALAQLDFLQKNGFETELFLVEWEREGRHYSGDNYNEEDHNIIASRLA
ncbi:MAG: hypothetical protein KAT77_02910 [Nanoarchaeota archaeon]|nr:hypothetical protein [Nanoarchaeota archaeon]